jgi:hypothetical protein
MLDQRTGATKCEKEKPTRHQVSAAQMSGAQQSILANSLNTNLSSA